MGSEKAQWAAVAVSSISAAIAAWQAWNARRAATASKRSADDARKMERILFQSKMDEDRDTAEADRVLKAAIELWRDELETNRLLGLSSRETKEAALVVAHGVAEVERTVVPSRLATVMERGVSVPATGHVRQAVVNKLNANAMVKGATIDGDAYRVRLSFNRTTFELEK